MPNPSCSWSSTALYLVELRGPLLPQLVFQHELVERDGDLAAERVVARQPPDPVDDGLRGDVRPQGLRVEAQAAVRAARGAAVAAYSNDEGRDDPGQRVVALNGRRDPARAAVCVPRPPRREQCGEVRRGREAARLRVLAQAAEDGLLQLLELHRGDEPLILRLQRVGAVAAVLLAQRNRDGGGRRDAARDAAAVDQLAAGPRRDLAQERDGESDGALAVGQVVAGREQAAD